MKEIGRGAEAVIYKIGRGAEAVIYKKDSSVLKERVRKSYRISFLDNRLRKSRTKREAKIISKLLLEKLFVPTILSQSDYSLELSYIDGEKVRDVLDDNVSLAKDIGLFIAKMHNVDVIHGDLTTSNMILSGSVVYFIDFGLSQFSDKVEDKAVDLHVLKQAMESYHSENCVTLISGILDSYEKECLNSEDVFTRLEQVEKRGRNKH